MRREHSSLDAIAFPSYSRQEVFRPDDIAVEPRTLIDGTFEGISGRAE